jgi:putative ABC transport system ATP-binding protein
MLRIEKFVAGYRSGAVASLPQLDVANGEAALILGPSGSGKTTLLLAIAGLARKFGGAVSVDGQDPFALKPAERDRFRGGSIGFVFQDLHLVTGLSTFDNVLLAPFAAHQKQDRERARALLDELGLASVAHKPAERISRGQAQRAAIARAMLLRPKVLLADEPTASLDDAACDVVAGLLLRAAAETGAALVIATHDARLKARIPKSVVAEPAP